VRRAKRTEVVKKGFMLIAEGEGEGKGNEGLVWKEKKHIRKVQVQSV